MSVQRIRQSIVSNWRTIASYGGLFAVLGAALFWKLGSLLPGYSESEANTYLASTDVPGLLDNPLNAPFLLAVKAFSYIIPDNYLATRVVAVIFALCVLAVFAVALRNWHGQRTSIIGTLLFGLSAWFLHTGRIGTPEVLAYGVFVLVMCGFWLKRTNSWLALVSCFVLTAGLLYVPGMIWFIGLCAIWQWKVIDRIFKKHLVAVTVSTIAILGALAPLAWAMYKNHAIIKPWLGLPSNWPTPIEMIKNLLGVPYHLLVNNAADPVMWLSTAPIMDVFALTMFVLGGYLYLRHFRLARTPIFVGILFVLLGLIAIGSSITFSVIMPFIYLVVAAGVAHLLNQWFEVFPRNPIARSIGWALICIVIAAVCVYHLTHYFVAWPQTTATNDVFTLQKP
ncbi:MAG TPA: hypothetical protein VF809_01515 [Candidatus Saccharimonadales bacterium]